MLRHHYVTEACIPSVLLLAQYFIIHFVNLTKFTTLVHLGTNTNNWLNVQCKRLSS